MLWIDLSKGDEVYNWLLYTKFCLSGAFVMTNVTHKRGEKHNRKAKLSPGNFKQSNAYFQWVYLCLKIHIC